MEDGEWVVADSHASTLLAQLSDQFQHQLLCDLTLSLNGDTFLLVHKAVLVACSGHFRQLLDGGWLNNNTYLVSSEYDFLFVGDNSGIL